MNHRLGLYFENTQDSVSGSDAHYAAVALPAKRKNRRAGFTMVEVIITVVILGIMATLVSVRLSNNLGRRAELVLRKVEIILETLAHKQIMNQNLMALVYDEQSRTMYLEVLSQWDDEEEPSWKQDIMSNPVVFDDEDIIFKGVYFDSEEINRSFRVLMPVNEARPAIMLEFVYGDVNEIIELLPHDVRTRRMSDLDYEFNRLLPVDLDKMGKSEDKWDI